MSTYTIRIKRTATGHTMDLVGPGDVVIARGLKIPDRLDLCHEDRDGVALAIDMRRLISEGMQGAAARLNGVATEPGQTDGPYIAEACVVRCSACHRKVCDVDMEYHEHMTDCEGDK